MARVIAAARTAVERAVLLVMYDLALRSSEVAKLRADQVDWRAGTIRTQRAKSDPTLELGAAGTTLDALRYVVVDGGQRFFPSWTAREVQKMVRAVFARAGLPCRLVRDGGKCFSHVLRRSRASHLLAAGVELRQVQRRLGHRSWQTTMLYAGLSPERNRAVDAQASEAVEALAKRPLPAQSGPRRP